MKEQMEKEKKWNLIKKEYFEGKVEFDVIEEFVEELIGVR